MKYKVKVSWWRSITVKAEQMEVNNGTIIFYSQSYDVVATFRHGEWLSFKSLRS